MGRYTTSQRKYLLEFFKQNSHKSFSAKQIKDEIGALGISTSSVYRNLAILEKDGILQKVLDSQKNETTYQHVNSKQCAELIHLICERCRNSFHFEKEVSELITHKARELKGFEVNKQNTFVYGTCRLCLEQE